MSVLTAEQRGDLAEQLLPVAAHLAVLVHGDGGPEDVAEVLAVLDETQKDALIVVLAGLVDPEQPVGKALGWLDFNEHGSVVVPSWSEQTSVRDLAPDGGTDDGQEFIDQVAVERFLTGAKVPLSEAERLEAVVRGVGRGLTYRDIDALHHVPVNTTATFISRLRKRYVQQGRPFPEMKHASQNLGLSDAQVVEMRELYAAGGVTDVEIAMRYGLLRKAVSNLLSGLTYRDAGGPIRESRKTRPPKRASRVGFNGGQEAFWREAAQAS